MTTQKKVFIYIIVFSIILSLPISFLLDEYNMIDLVFLIFFGLLSCRILYVVIKS